MNLEFNIAVHVLTFLSKHSSQRFSSVELSSKVCVNPVQLRRVMSKLLEEGYITTQKGKYGGYRINGNVLDTPLSIYLNYSLLVNHLAEFIQVQKKVTVKSQMK